MLIAFILLFSLFKKFNTVESIQNFNNDKNNCNSNSIIQVDQNTSDFLLTPPNDQEFPYDCEWKVGVDTLNETFMLKIDANLILKENEFLLITVCGTENVLFDTNSFGNQRETLFTQEEELCINFTSSTINDYDKEFISFWSIYFELVETPMKQNLYLSKNESINVLYEFSNYTIWNIYALDGSLQIYYYGIEPGMPISGTIYLYNSSNLKDIIAILRYPYNDIEQFNLTTCATLFYFGSSKNTIKLVTRIPEYHTANCVGGENLIFLNQYPIETEITATNGPCLLSFIIPSSILEYYANFLISHELEYYGDQSILIVEGYNNTFVVLNSSDALSLFDESRKEDYFLYIFGNFISFIIPSNSKLNGKFFVEMSGNTEMVSAHSFYDSFFDLQMSANYPNYEFANYNISRDVIYAVEYASITLVVFAYIPEDCYFSISVDGTTIMEITNQTLLDHTLVHNGTQVHIEFIGTNDSSIRWQGFLVRVFGERINPPNDTYHNIKRSKSKTSLIVGLSTGVSVIAVAIIVFFTYYQLKKRYRKFDTLCNILKEMNKSSEETLSLKEEMKKFLIPSGKIQIDFDCELGKGSTSTVYKGYLLGIAPLHLTQKSLHTQRFMDCDVAIKVNKNYGKDEVAQLFNEINAMQELGYHENIMCMLGWVFSKEMPCLFFDIADKSLMEFLKELCGCAEDQILRVKFLSILWQIARGKHIQGVFADGDLLGMEYMASKKLIHRSLVAKNILLFGNLVAKISDFGLCCFMDENLTYISSTLENLPIKWLSIESLTENIFSEKSDVWAFGVLMYEIFTLGKIPYETKNKDEMLEFLQTGNRLERPDGIEDMLYEIMLGCWHKETESRLPFDELVEKFHAFIEIRNEYYGYSQPMIYSQH